MARWVERSGKSVRLDAVELDSQASAGRKTNGLAKAAMSGGTDLLQQPNGGTGIGPDLIHPSLLTIEFLDDDEGEDHIVLIEAEKGVWVGEQDTGVEDESGVHQCLSGFLGCSQRRQLHHLTRELQGSDSIFLSGAPCR